jgi:cytochrome c oxidase subunit II
LVLTRINSAVIVLVSMMLAADSVTAGGDPAAGRLRFSVCGACHGLQGQGNEALGAPRIAGLPAWYTARQLQSFSNGMRGGPESDKTSRQMTTFALNLSAADIANLSAYLESLPRTENVHEESDDAAAEEAGQAAYQQCATCHGPNAEGVEALGAPPLSGLNAWYFKKQLEDFKSGIRGYSATDTFSASMRAIAQSIDTQETADAIAAYLQLIEQ